MSNDLPPGITEWLAQLGGGTLTRLERAVARREAWLVDVTRPDGTTMEGFLRLDRAPDERNPWSLRKEMEIVRALLGSTVPVTKIYGSSDALACVLFERLGGRADLHNVDPSRQHAVMSDFMNVVARLHTLPLDQLALPKMPQPTTAYECALGEVDLVLHHWSAFVASYQDPLLTYGIDWLRRFAPKHVDRICLVQGDTGPMNFMFDGDRVTAVFDWEWGHLGDPMEDLGNICVREFWNPSGGLEGMLARYERLSGIPVDMDSVRYYRVQQQMRGMVPSHCATVEVKPHEPLAWYLAYRYVGDRATCQAIAEAMGIELESPAFPTENEIRDPLAEAACWALSNDIEPATNTALASARTRDVDIIVRCMERVARYGAEIHAVECSEMAALLGKPVPSIEAGFAEMDVAIAEHRIADEPMIRYLSRRAFRNEWLHEPCTRLFPDRAWAKL